MLGNVRHTRGDRGDGGVVGGVVRGLISVESGKGRRG